MSELSKTDLNRQIITLKSIGIDLVPGKSTVENAITALAEKILFLEDRIRKLEEK